MTEEERLKKAKAEEDKAFAALPPQQKRRVL